jgi:hypothetical protein
MHAPSMTVAQIEAQTTDARECLALLNDEAKDLSLLVVSGDQDAAAKLAGINAEVRQITADLAVLDNARLVAAEQQRDASDAKDAAYRARHMTIARDRAAAIVSLASRVDQIVAEFKSVYSEMVGTEEQIRRALREAGTPPNDAAVGQRGLAVFAIASLTAITNGTDRFSRTRAVADVARMAWADLLVSERSDDV